MNERLFQYIWLHLYFDFRRLKTINNEKITIIHQGRLNQGDGPDFQDAVIKINDIIFHGSVELHLYAKDWFQHNHQKDERYNSVILHVVLFDSELIPVTRSDGTSPFTLVLKPYISSNIHSVFKKQNQDQQLSCSAFLKKIPDDIIHDQWEKSRTRYFEYKVDELLPFFDTSQDLWNSWKIMLAYGLFDGLGINDNRDSMKELCSHVTKDDHWKKLSISELRKYIWEISGLDEKSEIPVISKNRWSFSGTRPKNQPNIRIPQAANILFNLNHIPVPFSSTQINTGWQDIVRNQKNISDPIGQERKKILYATVYLPSLYLLAVKLNDSRLKNTVIKLWNNYQIVVPRKIMKKFKVTGLNQELLKNSLGVIYHYKHYCSTGQCRECKIMKYALKT